MERELDTLSTIELLYFVLCSRGLLFRKRVREMIFSAAAIYPERKKYVFRFLWTRLHITVSVEKPEEFHWIRG